MAEINGTNGNDVNLVGTTEDDVILALLGADNINGLEGNDSIDAGEDDKAADNIFGQDGNDTIVNAGVGDTVDGGDGDGDLLVSDLATADDVNGAADDGVTPTINGVSFASLVNVEMLQVSNANNTMLTLDENGIFGFDLALTSNDAGIAPVPSGVSAAPLTLFTAATGAVVTTPAQTDLAEGVMIGGTTYMSGETYTTAGGGTVAIGDDGSDFTFDYTPAVSQLLAVGDTKDATDDVLDESAQVTVTDTSGGTVNMKVDFSINHDADVDFSDTGLNVDTATRIIGDDQPNTLTGNGGNDSLIGQGGADTIDGGEGDDVMYAGKDDDAADSLTGGEGNDIIGGGAGNDTATGDDGNDELYGGEGDDSLDGGAGDDKVWSGDDDDKSVTGGDGDDIVGGGDGDDTLMGGKGDDAIYGGKDDGADSIAGDDGNDTIYGGDGDDKSLDGGKGDDVIYNGLGDDAVVTGGAGMDTLWGGEGADALTGGSEDDTFAFAAGNGADTITDFALTSATVGETGDKLDLTAFDFADTAAVLDALIEVSGNAVLVLSPGNTVTFTGVSVTDLNTTPDDWVMV